MSQSEEIAKLLLKIKAISLNLNHPFQYSSGLLSPIYCDNRLVISYPAIRTQVIDGFISLIEHHKLSFDIVAGTATAGIPHAAWLADRLNKPMVYIRSKAKGHGKKNRIEGVAKAGQSALIIEDLISTGGSVINAVEALRDADINVTNCLAIFSYGMKTAAEQLTDNQLSAHTLSDFRALLHAAESEGYIEPSQKEALELWKKDPAAWSQNAQAGLDQ